MIVVVVVVNVVSGGRFARVVVAVVVGIQVFRGRCAPGAAVRMVMMVVMVERVWEHFVCVVCVFCPGDRLEGLD